MASPTSTDFNRACKALETLEECLLKLAGPGSNQAPCVREDQEQALPPVDSEWIVVAGISHAAQAQVSKEERGCFLEAEDAVTLLKQLTVSMRRKCQAHSALEELRSTLSQHVTDTPPDLFSSAKSIIAAGGDDSGALQSLLDRALELNSVATYGAKMREKVSSMIARFDAAHAHFTSEVVPRLAAAVVAAEVEDAEQRKLAEQQAEDEERRAREHALRPVAELLECSEQKLRKHLEIQETEDCATRIADRVTTLAAQHIKAAVDAILALVPDLLFACLEAALDIITGFGLVITAARAMYYFTKFAYRKWRQQRAGIACNRNPWPT
eukprot:TRINITY_DN8202_c0_g1_i2.p1 TRINITY_DN8202_c0_g1~~TRINITY_DN8202_c0_g1_i2.p1  ORF type:complete len:326 (-),score=86.93 TRINITY_DN8202_c0_g1_i2:175-1152(-)